MKKMKVPEDEASFMKFTHAQGCRFLGCRFLGKITFSKYVCDLCGHIARDCKWSEVDAAVGQDSTIAASMRIIFDERIDSIRVLCGSRQLTREHYVISGKKLYFHIMTDDIRDVRVYYKLLTFNEHILRVHHAKG